MRTIIIVALTLLGNSLYSQSPGNPAGLLTDKGLINQFGENQPVKNIGWEFKSSNPSRLDSIVGYNYGLDNDSIRYYKEDYSQYDGDDWTVFVSSFWDTVKLEWIPDFRMEYRSLPSGNNTSRDKYDWDTLTKEWIPRDRYITEYEDDGRTIGNLIIVWNKDADEWVNSWQSVYSYSDDYIRSNQITSNWSTELNDWIPEFKYEYHFSIKDIMQSYERFKWLEESGEWLPHGKASYHYDDNNNINILYYWIWLEEPGEWVYSMKYDREFDHFGNITSSIRSDWDIESEQWVYINKNLKSFDSNNNMILDEFYSAISENLPTSRNVYEYDSDSYILSHYYYLQNLQTQVMVFRNRDLYLYNDDKSISIRRRSNWDKEIEEWVLYYSESWYYTFLSGIHNESLNAVSIFPNPTSGIVNIGGLQKPAKVDIYSIQGQLMKSFTLVDAYIDVSDFPPGMYLINLTSGNEHIVRKIVID